MKCIVKNCSNPSKTRQMCNQCYQAARTAVSRGQTTWDFLVKNKLAGGSPTSKGGRSAFMTELKKITQK